MSQSFRASSGKVVRLGPVLGKGGEGTVYAIDGDSQLAAKLYLRGLAKDRREKIAAMAQAGWHKAAKHVAFPIDTLFDQTGQFSGFTMRRVGGDKPIHQLYSPTGRKTSFPNASYPFLIRTVSNVARAIASVNATGCIVGDVNHSGVLVSKDASVTLIDCDFFRSLTAERSSHAKWACRNSHRQNFKGSHSTEFSVPRIMMLLVWRF